MMFLVCSTPGPPPRFGLSVNLTVDIELSPEIVSSNLSPTILTDPFISDIFLFSSEIESFSSFTSLRTVRRFSPLELSLIGVD